MIDPHQDAEPTQLTQPKGHDGEGEPYEPIEIPVPTEGDVMGLFEKVAHAPAEAGEHAPDGLRGR
ncbi:MAG TPA: hypothetical protein VN892_00100 [Solirubrobacteraceae bacterium]|nr:hypothetical protein [Solirubrobacteraceae bacterium]